MYANKFAISIFTVFLLATVLGVAYADTEDVNGTDNMSQSGNISANETNQSFKDQNLSTSSGTIHKTNNSVSTGGIKNFMKSFQYQSRV
ncbi:MAG: hypothetical protein V1862_12870 [Methanobacteriota archaeon]